MKNAYRFTAVLLFGWFGVGPVQAERLQKGDPISTSSEQSEIPQRVRDQIQELSSGIARRTPQFNMVGELVALGGDRYSVNGEEFSIDEKTLIYGGPINPGSKVHVRGELIRNKPKVAQQIVASKSVGEEGATGVASVAGGSFPPDPSQTR